MFSGGGLRLTRYNKNYLYFLTQFILTLGLLCDLLWSDPDDEVIMFDENDRGVSVRFGKNVVFDFNKKNVHYKIVRAHQVI
jgi:hypothetical protein